MFCGAVQKRIKDTGSSSLFRTVATTWVVGSGNKNHTNHAQTKRSFNLPTIIFQEPMLILGRVIFSKKKCREVLWCDFLWSLQKKRICCQGRSWTWTSTRILGDRCLGFSALQDVFGGVRLLKKGGNPGGEMVSIKGWLGFLQQGFLKDFCFVQIKKNARSEVFTCQKPKHRQNVTTYLRQKKSRLLLKAIWDVYMLQ